jgi:hypothetical protein
MMYGLSGEQHAIASCYQGDACDLRIVRAESGSAGSKTAKQAVQQNPR